jgi:diguanylate cyclase (GGDEF)-like protein
MRLFAKKNRILLWIGMLLLAGFLATDIASFVGARAALGLTGVGVRPEILGQIRQVFALNVLVGAGVTLLVLRITLEILLRHRRQLEVVAGSDVLTGLPNRPAFEIVFAQATREEARNGRPLSAVLLDVDYFTQINDRYGHLAGDKVLQAVAQVVRGMLRESDAVARWSGQEFIVLLKECSLNQAALVAEKLRVAIDRHDFSGVFAGQQVTISLGVAQYFRGESAASFFGRADQALHRAKANGMNRLQVALVESAEREVISE